jgi:ferric-dicitrate binding protein FerR (iron transport regulator)
MASGCVEIEAQLINAADGRLDPAASVRFHAHLEGCAACRERAALWRALTPAMRAAVPASPDAMATRRMQIEIERRMARQVAPAPARRWVTISAAGGLLAAAAFAALWLRPHAPPPPSPVGYATLAHVAGGLSVGDRPTAAGSRVAVGAPLSLAPGASVELALDGGATLRLKGPARLALEGQTGAVAVRLASGRVEAAVAHRQPGQTFAVVTPDLRVEVRGTTFSVAKGPTGSRVEVSEGRVLVSFADGRSTFVAAGGSLDTAVHDEPAPAPPPGEGPPAACSEIARACQATTRAARASMRSRDAGHALRLIADGSRNAGEATCGRDVVACQDELGYLRAEALNLRGQVAEAVAAYHALDKRGAPPAMRQNALYAAAQLERRQGRTAEARTDYERALAAAPRGALHEEALLGAMESAEAAGDAARAGALAGQYLDEFPNGRAASAARRLADARP